MTRNELINMSADDLAKALNDLLSKAESKNKLFKILDIKKQTIDKKLMQAGYIYDNVTKTYVKTDCTDQVTLNSDDSKEIINDLIKRISELESRVDGIESKKSNEFE